MPMSSFRSFHMTVALYFWLSFVGLLGLGVMVYLVFIEPRRVIITEIIPPRIKENHLRAGETMIISRDFVVYRACPSDVLRQLSCKDGYQHLYPSTQGHFEPGPHSLQFYVPLPHDVPVGQCVFQVVFDYRCVWLTQSVKLQPILVDIVE